MSRLSVISSVDAINAVNLYSIGYCWPRLTVPCMPILQLDDSLTPRYDKDLECALGKYNLF